MPKIKKTRKLGLKQIEKQMNTWRKNYPLKFHEIAMRAMQLGVLDEDTHKLTDKNKQRYDDFVWFYQRYYGSFSNYEKTAKEKWREAKREGTTDLTWKEYWKEKTTYSELIDSLFDTFTSDIAYEEYLNLQGMNREDAIRRLRTEIRNREISPTDNYKKKYGNIEPGF